MKQTFIVNGIDILKQVDELQQENEELKKALEEIREILIICTEFKTCEKCKFFKDCNKDLEGCILDKINEVLK